MAVALECLKFVRAGLTEWRSKFTFVHLQGQNKCGQPDVRSAPQAWLLAWLDLLFGYSNPVWAITRSTQKKKKSPPMEDDASLDAFCDFQSGTMRMNIQK